MDTRRSIGWVALGVGTLAGAVGLALLIGCWDARALDEHGRALVAGGAYVPAIRVLSGIVAEAPGDAGAHYYLGLAYAGIGLCGAAWMHLEEAARLAPAYRRHRATLGPACRAADPNGSTGPFDLAVANDRQ